jgi:hypothetical protein
LTFFLLCVLYPFVSDAPNTADRPSPTDPATDRAAGTVPERIAKVLSLLHWIIGYGQRLAAAARQSKSTPGADLTFFSIRYGTSDLALILTRIQRGLMLAAGLQDRLQQRAATGRDVRALPLRDPTERKRPDGVPPRKCAPRRTNIVDLPLDRLPSAEEIAEELRHRPLGAIVVDICRDLGIVPNDLPKELRQILHDIILNYGGNLVVLLFKEDGDRLRARVEAEIARLKALPPPAPRRAVPAAAATGPP